ncbi:MAG: S-methyl-5'-thioinosine phosphorylase [Methylococcaceae bacterium]
MTTLAIIGGTGLTQLSSLNIIGSQSLDTPYGKPSADFVTAEWQGKPVIFLARHGNPHQIAPHHINYRANIWGLKQLGVQHIIAVAAVGGITAEMSPAHIAIPDQLIDYTYGREHTFFAEKDAVVQHIDFTHPYSQSLRHLLITAAEKAVIRVQTRGTYGCTQGPRLETSAEIRKMERDGCDLVGMTGMPEAALARELEIDYAAVAVVANWAAGKTAHDITMAEIEENLHKGMANTGELLKAVIALL